MTTVMQQKPPDALARYFNRYENSIKNKELFWKEAAAALSWNQFPEVICKESGEQELASWFSDGTITPTDTIFKTDRYHQPAIVDGASGRSFSYQELFEKVCRAAQALNDRGMKKGDHILIINPSCFEAMVMMLAAAALGAVSVPVPDSYSESLLHEIINDCLPQGIFISGKRITQGFLEAMCHKEEYIVIQASDRPHPDSSATDFNAFLNGGEGSGYTPEPLSAEDPLFLVYSHSSSGNLKGLIYRVGGYLVQLNTTFHSIITPESQAVLSSFSLTSSVGLGYGFWGPLLAGKTVIVSEGKGLGLKKDILKIHDKSILEKTVLLTNPEHLRQFKVELEEAEESDDPEEGKKQEAVEEESISPTGVGRFAQIISSGAPIPPSLARYIAKHLLEKEWLLTNMWIQSQSGTSVIHSIPNESLNIPGALGLPALGVEFEIMTDMGQHCRINESGQIMISGAWPSMPGGIWGRDSLFKTLYFTRIPGYFSTNDAGRIDAAGFFWFMGRLDDMIRISEHSISTSDIESLIFSSDLVSNAAVVGNRNNELTVFVVPLSPCETSEERELIAEKVKTYLREKIGDFACPEEIHVTQELPRTRSGKLARNLLRRIAARELLEEKDDIGYITNPDAVNKLLGGRSHDTESID